MRFTLLSTVVASQTLAWCILGTSVHGWQILCYPLAWAFIAGGFLALNHYFDQLHAATKVVPATVEPLANVGEMQHSVAAARHQATMGA